MAKEIAVYMSPEDKTKMINLSYFWDLISWKDLRNPVDNLILFNSLKEVSQIFLTVKNFFQNNITKKSIETKPQQTVLSYLAF